MADAAISELPGRRSSAPAVVALLLAVLLTFGRLVNADFSWWDDQKTLHQNPLFNPPTLDTLRAYWTTPSLGLYVPITQTVWAAIARVAYVGVPDEYNVSLDPLPFHAASLGLHALSAWIVYAMLRRLLPATATAACLGAMLFALHPVQVESVAWISGMKDLLCWAATLAAVLVYVRRVGSIRSGDAALWRGPAMPLAMGLVVLGILSKPTAVVAPAVMVAVDGLLLRRRWRRALVELLPMFALSAAGAGLARYVQVVAPAGQAPPWQRPIVAGDAFAFYLAKLAWPATLTIDYGRTPTAVVAGGSTLWWIAVPAALAVALFVARRRRPALALAGAIFAIGIAPVSGLATFEMQAISTTADHYLYGSMLGPAIALAWALDRWPGRRPRAAVVVLLAALAVRSFDQCQHWRTGLSLIEHAASANPNSVTAQNNLAAIQMRRREPRLDLAEIAAKRAIELKPDDVFALQIYGIVEGRLGHAPESVAAFERLWQRRDQVRGNEPFLYDETRFAVESMMRLGEYGRAITWIQRGMELKGNSYEDRANLALARRLLDRQRTARVATRAATSRPDGAESPGE